MAIRPPEQRIWWNEPVERGELVWIGIAFLWGIVMFFMMVWWHFSGEQNLSNEAYRIHPDDFATRTEAMAEAHTVREEGDTGYPVVRPPPGSDVYMLARLWEWWPILELERGQSYRLHLSSMDWQHGFSLQPENINIQVHPGYELVMQVTPDEGRVQRRLQRVLRHRPPHHGRQDLRGRAGPGRGSGRGRGGLRWRPPQRRCAVVCRARRGSGSARRPGCASTSPRRR